MKDNIDSYGFFHLSSSTRRATPAARRLPPQYEERAIHTPTMTLPPLPSRPVASARPKQEAIVFRDPYGDEVGSVATGMSQQELIRKKVRASQRKKNKYTPKKKKKSKIQILGNTFLSRNKGEAEYKGMLSVSTAGESSSVPSRKWRLFGPQQQQQPEPSPEDVDLSTAETTTSDVSPVEPPQPRKVLEADASPFVLNEPPLKVGEMDTSFPVLSKNATKCFESVEHNASHASEASDSRRVRFAQQLIAPPRSIHRASPTSAVSILRESRFPPTQKSRSGSCVTPPRRTTPPRSSPAPSRSFCDQDSGVSLSPIRPNLHHFGHPAEKAFVSEELLMSSSVARSVEYPDPPLELQLDDESTLASTKTPFLEIVAAIVIQTEYRRYRASCYVRALRNSTYRQKYISQPVGDELMPSRPALRAVSLTPDESRPAYKERQLMRTGAMDMFELAAVRIQAVFRGFWTRDSLDVDHFCASMIQKSFRRHLVRRLYQDTIRRATAIQAFHRGNRVRTELACINQAATSMQSAVRVVLAKKLLRRKRKKRTKKVSSRSASWQQQLVGTSWHAHQLSNAGSLPPKNASNNRTIDLRNSSVSERKEMERIFPTKAIDLSTESTVMAGNTKQHAGGLAAPVPKKIRKKRSRSRPPLSPESAATLIQTKYRCFVCECRFIRSLVDILIVQAVGRRWLAKQQASRLRKAKGIGLAKPAINGKGTARIATSAPSHSVSLKPTSARKVVSSFAPEAATAKSTLTPASLLKSVNTRQVISASAPGAASAKPQSTLTPASLIRSANARHVVSGSARATATTKQSSCQTAASLLRSANTKKVVSGSAPEAPETQQSTPIFPSLGADSHAVVSDKRNAPLSSIIEKWNNKQSEHRVREEAKTALKQSKSLHQPAEVNSKKVPLSSRPKKDVSSTEGPPGSTSGSISTVKPKTGFLSHPRAVSPPGDAIETKSDQQCAVEASPIRLNHQDETPSGHKGISNLDTRSLSVSGKSLVGERAKMFNSASKSAADTNDSLRGLRSIRSAGLAKVDPKVPTRNAEPVVASPSATRSDPVKLGVAEYSSRRVIATPGALDTSSHYGASRGLGLRPVLPREDQDEPVPLSKQRVSETFREGSTPQKGFSELASSAQARSPERDSVNCIEKPQTPNQPETKPLVAEESPILEIIDSPSDEIEKAPSLSLKESRSDDRDMLSAWRSRGMLSKS